VNTLSPDNVNTSNPHPYSVPNLITGKDGLNYCCMYGFFSIYRRTAQIALRLGVTDRTVRVYKAKFKEGEYECEKRDCCLKKAITEIKLTGLPKGLK